MAPLPIAKGQQGTAEEGRARDVWTCVYGPSLSFFFFLSLSQEL